MSYEKKSELRLGDLGERRILREIIPKYVNGAGDDCAEFKLSDPYIVATMDPVPRPAAEVLGGDSDPFWLGWLLVTINASDIAASGCRPRTFLASIDLPADYFVHRFERLLEGIKASCSVHGLTYVGGNMREAASVAATGAAIGSSSQAPLRRVGAQPGDFLVLFGRGGRFWSHALDLEAGIPINRSESPIFAPVAQSRSMFQYHELGLLQCGMDSSDGLAPTLEELAIVNSLRIEIDLSSLRNSSSDLTRRDGIERLWFGWGDWTVVGAVSPPNLQKLQSLEGSFTVIGRFHSGDAEVILFDGHKRSRASRLESERFAKDSWFVAGVDEYKRRLLDFPLPQ